MMNNIYRNVIKQYGEPIEFHPKNGAASYLRASVQSEAQEALINDLDQSRYIVYICPEDISSVPLKFDRVKVRGELFALDEDAKVEYLNGTPLMYVVRILG